MHNKIFKNAFSLTELLVSITIMAVLSLLVVAAVAKKTVKDFTAPKTGKLICYKDMKGDLHQRKEIGGKVEDKIVIECKFTSEDLAGAKNAVIYVIGGGGGGAVTDLSGALSVSKGDVFPRIEYDIYEYNNSGEDLYTSSTTATTNLKYCCEGNLDAQVCTTGNTRNVTVPFNVNSAIFSYDNAGGAANDWQVQPKNNGDIVKHVHKHTDLYDTVCGQSRSIADAAKPIKRYFESTFTDSIISKIFKEGSVHDQIYGSNSDKIYATALLNKGTYEGVYKSGKCTHYYSLKNLTDIGSYYAEYCYCKDGNTVKCDTDHNMYFSSVDILFSSMVKVTTKINGINIGNRGRNGGLVTVDTYSYNGGDLIIKANCEDGKSCVGSGGNVGSKGGDTKLFLNGEIYTALGGNGGTVRRNFKMPIPSNVELLENQKLTAKTDIDDLHSSYIAVSPEYLDQNNGLSDYVNENMGGIVNPEQIILPNATCEIRTNNDKDGYTIAYTGYDSSKDNYYNRNYGGGGGGYLPCMEYRHILPQSYRSYYIFSDGSSYSNHEWKTYTGTKSIFETPVYIEKDKYHSSKGMGGAIVIQW